MFDGVTFDEVRDGERLGLQLKAVKALMLDGKWRTLGEISERIGSPQASVSARLRDLRKAKFGGYEVKRKYLYGGLYQYQIKEKENHESV